MKKEANMIYNEQWTNFNAEIAIVSYEPDDQVKEKKMITLTQEVIPFYLTKMNVVAKENDGHLVLNRVSWIVSWNQHFNDVQWYS